MDDGMQPNKVVLRDTICSFFGDSLPKERDFCCYMSQLLVRMIVSQVIYISLSLSRFSACLQFRTLKWVSRWRRRFGKFLKSLLLHQPRLRDCRRF